MTFDIFKKKFLDILKKNDNSMIYRELCEEFFNSISKEELKKIETPYTDRSRLTYFDKWYLKLLLKGYIEEDFLYDDLFVILIDDD